MAASDAMRRVVLGHSGNDVSIDTAAIPWLDRLDREEREHVMGRNLLELLRPS
jgi:hypothetical protein